MSFYEISLLAVVLAMDSFSVSIGIGVQDTSSTELLKFSFLVAIFHVVLPLLGLYIGGLVGTFFGQAANYLGSVFLMLLGINMIRKDFQAETEELEESQLQGANLYLIPLSVSIDTLTIGFSLGAVGVISLNVALFFGGVAFLMTIGGAVVGRQLGKVVTRTGLWAGLILLGLGLRMLFM
ncbi:manganese efflux pump MntP [Fuchsiella alkaliacetigena]|uniref:manganese efflux pump MntP n=1 Tax=Fuchsiella alkaliacetigena TaxID=957042 RepID=UPI00200B164F|nr:manganese efflux pump [Fuchsiella alkaliacetigena]MCK8824596.1 manganese efflux pump MntP family protein [Fuchsiella alkaliacetigena]